MHYGSISTILGNKYTNSHLLHNIIFPPVLPHMQQIKILLSNCFIQRNFNVHPDDGPVGSQTCRQVMFFKNIVVNEMTVCAFVGWNCVNWTFGLYEMQEIYWLAEEVLASQQEIQFSDFVSYFLLVHKVEELQFVLNVLNTSKKTSALLR